VGWDDERSRQQRFAALAAARLLQPAGTAAQHEQDQPNHFTYLCFITLLITATHNSGT
jgi:hypothetical protein